MGRDDALDLLVRTACSMPWMSVTQSTNDPTANLDADERPGADVIDPLLLHADAATDLISLCEGLLARRRAEPENQALRRAPGSAQTGEEGADAFGFGGRLVWLGVFSTLHPFGAGSPVLAPFANNFIPLSGYARN
jgi:hypothetical protein